MTQRDPAIFAAYRIAMVHGLIPLADVWALINQEIEQSEILNDALLAAADARADSIAELTTALTLLSASADVPQTSRYVMGIAKKVLAASPDRAEEVAKTLYSMASDGIIPDPAARSKMFSLEDAFELANAGTYRTRKEVLSELQALLAEHGIPTDA